ncbi:hypothetical protein BRPE64_CCDS03300 [Caballeronia insecticola]|uniref:Uncharacterized protein n=1 Tax=Caballeronia insecticola TaxID=758793 RepID=R4WP31_9BURK|nr:hypothetical protein BRPE64_CCDS03300 [Caballeronia insecticola]
MVQTALAVASCHVARDIDSAHRQRAWPRIIHSVNRVARHPGSRYTASAVFGLTTSIGLTARRNRKTNRKTKLEAPV